MVGEITRQPRRVPGAGIVTQTPTPLNVGKLLDIPKRAKAKVKLSFSPEVPKQWRHLAIVALALVVAAIGVDGQTVSRDNDGDTNRLAATTRTQSAKASEGFTSSLPTVKSINLPPIPTKNSGVKEPNIAAAGVALIDDASKLPLFLRAGDKRRAVASTTKIITAQIVMQQYKNLDQPIVLTKEAVNQIGSGVGFHPGETATIRQLLHGLLMVSGNDAAKQLSELKVAEGGQTSTDLFVAEMNKLAQRLGMSGSHFYDPAGLDDQGYSTPIDMTKAMSNLVTYPELVKIIGTADYEYRSPEGYLHTFHNSNRLITPEMYYQGMVGGKTGFTPETADGGAGHCLIVVAERSGHRLIAAVYGTYSNLPEASAEVARAALDYGFNNFTWTTLAR